MENMSSTLPHIQKVLISIGNTLTDSIIHNDNEFRKLTTILSQQTYGEVMHKNKREDINQIRRILEELSQLGKKHNNYVTQTIAEKILSELKSYNTNLINWREKILTQFKQLDIESNDLKIEVKPILSKIEHLDYKDELTSLKEHIFDLQNDLTSLRIHELCKLKKLIEQNQQVINMIKPIDIKKLETTVHELNKKIPDIEPLLKEFEKMFKTLDNISKAVGYKE